MTSSELAAASPEMRKAQAHAHLRVTAPDTETMSMDLLGALISFGIAGVFLAGRLRSAAG